MRRAFALAVFCILAAGSAGAEEKVVRLDDPALKIEGALWKTMDVRFSDSFAKGRLASPDAAGLAVSELPPGKICFQSGDDGGIDIAAPAMAEFARADKGDFCLSRSDVSARYEPVIAAGAPPSPFYSLDKAVCHWSWKQGKGIGMWYEDCDYGDGGGKWDVAYDEEIGGFVTKQAGSEDVAPLLLQFRKEGGPEALLPELKATGKVLDNPECQFQPVKDAVFPLSAGWTAWEVAPTGKLKEDFDKASQGDDIPDPPCGDLGLAVDFVGFFLVNKDFPDRILYADLGQDVSPMDLPSITLAQ